MILMFRCVLFYVTFVLCGAKSENVVKLTKFNYEQNVAQGSWFVKYYAPWCTHCQKLAPMWDKLADLAVTEDWAVKIADVDCTTSKDICDKAKVKGYPTLTLLRGGVEIDQYQGASNLATFQNWLQGILDLRTGTLMKTIESESVPSVESKAETGVREVSLLHTVGGFLRNLVNWFPTKSRILNVYAWGGFLLVTIVSVLCALFRSIDDELPEEKDKIH